MGRPSPSKRYVTRPCPTLAKQNSSGIGKGSPSRHGTSARTQRPCRAVRAISGSRERNPRRSGASPPHGRSTPRRNSPAGASSSREKQPAVLGNAQQHLAPVALHVQPVQSLLRSPAHRPQLRLLSPRTHVQRPHAAIRQTDRIFHGAPPPFTKNRPVPYYAQACFLMSSPPFTPDGSTSARS